MSQIPLKPLHLDETLVDVKLRRYDKLSTEDLLNSLRPGQQGALKVRPDGTIIDGHHHIKILRERGVNVNSLPREVITKDDL